ncbi:hypothetical protein FALBO_3616, partial [Fusarium albosuccineum]
MDASLVSPRDAILGCLLWLRLRFPELFVLLRLGKALCCVRPTPPASTARKHGPSFSFPSSTSSSQPPPPPPLLRPLHRSPIVILQITSVWSRLSSLRWPRGPVPLPLPPGADGHTNALNRFEHYKSRAANHDQVLHDLAAAAEWERTAANLSDNSAFAELWAAAHGRDRSFNNLELGILTYQTDNGDDEAPAEEELTILPSPPPPTISHCLANYLHPFGRRVLSDMFIARRTMLTTRRCGSSSPRFQTVNIPAIAISPLNMATKKINKSTIPKAKRQVSAETK